MSSQLESALKSHRASRASVAASKLDVSGGNVRARIVAHFAFQLG
jgi:hypothetical protein